MKNKVILSILFVLLLLLPCFAAAFSYTHTESGLSFEIPSGWEQKELTAERENLQVAFMPSNGDLAHISFGAYDIWSELSSIDKVGFQRSDMDINSISKDEVAAIYDIFDDSVTDTTLGGIKYYKLTFPTSTSVYGVDITTDNTVFITCHNGYYYFFQYSELRDSGNGRYRDFYEMIQNANYPSVQKSSYTTTSVFPALLRSLLLTVGVYTAPIAVYRYLVLGKPLEEKRAKKITIVYAIVSFIIMSLILNSLYGQGTAGYSIVLWSGINYALLTKGRKAPDTDILTADSEKQTDVLPHEQSGENTLLTTDDQPQQKSEIKVREETKASTATTVRAPTEICFCHKCGNRLVEGSVFCNKCGTKIIR